MQLCSCVVRHAGSLTMTVVKENVTPPEAVLLRHIHGPDAVQHLVAHRMTTRARREEWLRLADIYGPAVLAEAWPGVMAHNRLPATLQEAGIPEGEPLTPPVDDDLEAMAAAVGQQFGPEVAAAALAGGKEMAGDPADLD